MDPPLEDKVAFFQRLDAMQSEDGEDDAYDVEEEAHRERCRRFHTKPSTSTRFESQAASIEGTKKTRAPSQGPSKFQDTDVDNDDDDDVQIIKVTPRNTNITREAIAQVGDGAHGMDEDVVPDSTRAIEKKSLPASLHQVLRNRITRQIIPTSDSPSPSVGKRKKEPKWKLVPEKQRIFKGLRFYYIPNDDVNGVRKHQINKAREYGAEWVRTLGEASHVIVDQNLTYKDIEPQLIAHPSSLTKIIVDASYPTDCVGYRTLLDPAQEKYVRNLIIPEDTTGIEGSNEEAPSLQISKPSRKQGRSSRRAQESSSSNESDDEQPKDPSRDGTEPNASHRNVLATAANDELSQYIGLVQENSFYQQVPLEDEDEASETGSSEYEQAKKRLKTGKQQQKSQEELGKQENFACMKGGTEGGNPNNPNARTIEILQEMADQYEHRDRWRSLSYRKGIATLRQQDKKVATAKEAVKLPNIGSSLAEKIEEIVASDRLKKLDNMKQEPENIIIKTFLKIYGVGMNQASKWAAQGYRTLEDLQQKAQLTPSQRVGLEHFDDLNERIPRWEVEALAGVVRKTAVTIDTSVEFIIGGSYRRGAENSGDIDLIITKKGTETSQELLHFLRKLVGLLTDKGFLTAALASFSRNASKDHGSKWHGCCVLPETAFPEDKGQYRPTWRRIDLLLVPESEFGAALIYFTGNDIFNRSIRLLATKKNMRLNQRGLFKDVLRGPGGVKYSEGDLLEARDEKRIFELLGVKWREPHERWC